MAGPARSLCLRRKCAGTEQGKAIGTLLGCVGAVASQTRGGRDAESARQLTVTPMSVLREIHNVKSLYGAGDITSLFALLLP